MADLDDVVLAIPHYECPECSWTYDMNRSRWFSKFSNKQLKDREKIEKEHPHTLLATVSCSNVNCGQYSVIKVIRIPYAKVSNTRVDLE